MPDDRKVAFIINKPYKVRHNRIQNSIWKSILLVHQKFHEIAAAQRIVSTSNSRDHQFYSGQQVNYTRLIILSPLLNKLILTGHSVDAPLLLSSNALENTVPHNLQKHGMENITVRTHPTKLMKSLYLDFEQIYKPSQVYAHSVEASNYLFVPQYSISAIFKRATLIKKQWPCCQMQLKDYI